VGYTGGWFNNPAYRDVCADNTGHAEAVQIQFDPNEVSYEDLLDVFWSIHNPTTENRQGPDMGSQYRSMIAYHTPEQELAAKKSKETQYSFILISQLQQPLSYLLADLTRC
jgi:peptide-methionine (S)-S-oxide reductase